MLVVTFKHLIVACLIALVLHGTRKYSIMRKKNTKTDNSIALRSNIIQFDEMGYPLRLVLLKNGEQVWLDTYEQKEDLILEWSRDARGNHE